MSKETLKYEVTALQMAVCKLVAELNLVFRSGCYGWNVSKGLNFEVSEYTPYHKDKSVNIYPVGWPEGSRIWCRFEPMPEERWWPFEGQIWANHLSPKLRFVFKRVDHGFDIECVERPVCEEFKKGLKNLSAQVEYSYERALR